MRSGGIVPYNQPNGVIVRPAERQHRPNRIDSGPFKCDHCGFHILTALPVVYERGSSITRSRRGLILKTGWAEARKHSFQALRTAPPRKRRIVWRLLVFAVALYLVRHGDGRPVPAIHLPFDLSTLGLIGGLIGVFLVMDAIRFNRIVYPRKMADWRDSYHCRRCNRIKIIRKSGL